MSGWDPGAEALTECRCAYREIHDIAQDLACAVADRDPAAIIRLTEQARWHLQILLTHATKGNT